MLEKVLIITTELTHNDIHCSIVFHSKLLGGSSIMLIDKFIIIKFICSLYYHTALKILKIICFNVTNHQSTT